MKRTTLSAENWIDGFVDVVITEGKNTVKIKSKQHAEVAVRWGTIGHRSRENKPRWLVYIEGSFHPDIKIRPDQDRQLMFCEYMGVYREYPWRENIAESAAITAWKVMMSTY